MKQPQLIKYWETRKTNSSQCTEQASSQESQSSRKAFNVSRLLGILLIVSILGLLISIALLEKQYTLIFLAISFVLANAYLLIGVPYESSIRSKTLSNEERSRIFSKCNRNVKITIGNKNKFENG